MLIGYALVHPTREVGRPGHFFKEEYYRNMYHQSYAHLCIEYKRFNRERSKSQSALLPYTSLRSLTSRS